MFLVLDLFESAPEVAAAPKPDAAAPSIDLFGTGKLSNFSLHSFSEMFSWLNSLYSLTCDNAFVRFLALISALYSLLLGFGLFPSGRCVLLPAAGGLSRARGRAHRGPPIR